MCIITSVLGLTYVLVRAKRRSGAQVVWFSLTHALLADPFTKFSEKAQ